jgi:hypothetical protein
MMNVTEQLSAAQFQEALRQVPRYRERPVIGDPLASAVTRIELNPAFAQSRLLTRILVALTYQEGEFRRAELGALDAETFAMVINLMDAFVSGSSSRAAWEAAVASAKAAEAREGG